MGIVGWIGVGCACWCAVSCGLGLLAAKVLAVPDRWVAGPDRVVAVDGRRHSGPTP
jgi:hypothetical protein